ncbi:hypothetical protein GOV05_01005 [Candidatus Woesearchaeota archaeon]|nr:hypothetical protein [Candidatus Woesearchaeota archaeon]
MRVFMGGVFLSASIYRVINPSLAILELQSLHLPTFLGWPLIIFEFFLGVSFLSNKYVKQALLSGMVFLTFAITVATFTNIRGVLSALSELFVLNHTPTDLLLHFFFLLILSYLYLLDYSKIKTKKKK